MEGAQCIWTLGTVPRSLGSRVSAKAAAHARPAADSDSECNLHQHLLRRRVRGTTAHGGVQPGVCICESWVTHATWPPAMFPLPRRMDAYVHSGTQGRSSCQLSARHHDGRWALAGRSPQPPSLAAPRPTDTGCCLGPGRLGAATVGGVRRWFRGRQCWAQVSDGGIGGYDALGVYVSRNTWLLGSGGCGRRGAPARE